MRTARFVCFFSIFVFATALLVLLAAQSNPAVHAHQPAALSAATAQPETGKPKVLANAVVYETEANSATSVALADLNGDGYPDIVVAAVYSGISVLMGNGDGTFQAPVLYPTSLNASAAVSLAIGDVNGDGRLDLVVVSGYISSPDSGASVNVILGNGDGTFQAPNEFFSSAGNGANSVLIKDVNGDGHPDLILADGCQSPNCSLGSNGGVSVLLGNGDGTFQAEVIYDSGGVQAQSIALVDMNGDGYPDLIVANLCENGRNCDLNGLTGTGGPGGVSVLQGNGDGTFQSAVSYYSGGYDANPIAIGDVNGDGLPDVIVANNCESGSDCAHKVGPGGVSVLFGNGDGTLQAAVSYSSGGYGTSSLAIADLNGDGYPDVVVAGNKSAGNYPHGQLGLLLGVGDGSFQEPASFQSRGYSAEGLAALDVNGDGRPDVVVVNNYARLFRSGSGKVGVLLNISTSKPSVALTSSPNPSHVNQSVTFKATVTSNPSIPNGEVVTFYDGNINLGTGTTTNGVATLITSFSQAKTHPIKASYPGDAFHKAKTSGTLKQVVNP
jgi:hypothetical protein